MIKNIIRLNSLISLALLLFTCSPQVDTPVYIYIEDADFTATNEQGTSSFKIPDVWVTVNGKGIGTYQLPALVPIIANGNTELLFEAGIKLNGKSDWRPKHPLFTLHKEVLNLTKGKIDTIYPLFRYQDIVKFPPEGFEDFENAGLKFFPVEGSAKLDKTNDPALIFHYRNEPNNFSGIITLPYADSICFFEIKTAKLELNSNTAVDCCVELNYCFDENVEIGMYCYYSPNSSTRTQQIPIANVVGTENNTEWNKIYINLADEMAVATTSGMTHFEVYMKCGIPKEKTAKFLFDNIKIVHR